MSTLTFLQLVRLFLEQLEHSTMGVLDDYFLGRTREQRAVARAQLDAMQDSKIVALSAKGALVETIDRRASTIGAAVALQRTTGSVPAGFFNTLSRESLVPFGEGGEARFDSLTKQGIGVGSNARAITGVLDNVRAPALPEGRQQFGGVLRDFFKGNGGKRQRPSNGGFNGGSGGSRFGGAPNPSGGKLSSPTSALRDGYGLKGGVSDEEYLLNLNPFLDRSRSRGGGGFR